jgi:hypothetical protein
MLAVVLLLVSAKEEQFVANDVVSDRAAELVPLQTVVPRSEEVPR